MRYQETELKLKNGQTAVLRNAEVEDSSALLKYLKATAAETRYLVNEPEEVTLTLEQEAEFLLEKAESERELMLIATIDGEHAGNCSVCSLGTKQRYRHRCSVGIALYKKYWGIGLGRQMLTAVLKRAEECGYEQAELEVVVDNTAAIALYKSLGFEIYGILKHDMKYSDGIYGDTYHMVKYF